MNLTISFFVSGHLRESRQVATPCSIGRSKHASWVLTHSMLSRNHCILSEKKDELYISDSGSLNGAFVNGMPLTGPVRLQFGDEFSIGNDLLFRISPPLEQSSDFDRYAGHTTTKNVRNKTSAPNTAGEKTKGSTEDDVKDDTDLAPCISSGK